MQGEKAKLTPVTVSEAMLREYAGTYGTSKITLDNGALYYQRTVPKYRLLPMTQTIFFLEGLDHIRVEFVLEGGKVKELVGLYDDGRREPSQRTR
jgi:hypothetical protein